MAFIDERVVTSVRVLEYIKNEEMCLSFEKAIVVILNGVKAETCDESFDIKFD